MTDKTFNEVMILLSQVIYHPRVCKRTTQNIPITPLDEQVLHE